VNDRDEFMDNHGLLASNLNAEQTQIIALLNAYRPADRSQIDACELFKAFALSEKNCCERTLSIGHFTGSAWLVSADGQRVLLTHHRKLNRWLQLGGHADGDSDIARVALREAEEESGLTDLVVERGIFDLDRHAIPARGSEPEHWHYDVRFVVRCKGSEQFAVSEESHALAWKSIEDIAGDKSADESLRRMAQRWLREN
jgi:8-oxo-dGTP pyrophosphatase MutT (NUDIX family)